MKTFMALPVYFNFTYMHRFTACSRRLISSAILLLPLFLQAGILYVNPSAAGLNNGSTWANGFTSLASALLAAKSGDEIWVKKGVYKPTTKVDVNNNAVTEQAEMTFQVPNGVSVYGGFSGSELSREQRSTGLNPTILSGDIDNNDLNADNNSIAEHTDQLVGTNAYHVIYTLNVSAATTVDGFIITSGKAMHAGPATDANQDGGAWYNNLGGAVNASSPTIRNCIFQGNYAASEGGAIYNNAPPGGTVASLISTCKFINNKSNLNGGALHLGSFSAGNYQLHITGCEFIGNEAYRRGGAFYSIGDHAAIDSSLFRNNKVTAISPNGDTFVGSGGAAGLVASNAAFNHCIFEANSATGNPSGPLEGGGGGAVYITTNESQTLTLGISAPSFVSCGFYSNKSSGNTTAWGGAVEHLNDAGKLRPKYVNCIFWGNEAHDDGGAIGNFTRVSFAPTQGFVPELTLNLTNCTFTNNQAGKKGGAIYSHGYDYNGSQILKARMENSIFWNNSAGVDGPEIFSTATHVIAYSLIKGSGGSGGGWKTALGTDGGNNLDMNPGFININDADGADNIPATADDGLKLSQGANALNKGNNTATGLTGITTDFMSAKRINGGKVDLGGYERGGFIFPGSKTLSLTNWNPKADCSGCSWAFIFSDRKFQHFNWDGAATMIETEAGTRITGRIVNRDNSRMAFDVYIELTRKQDWQSWSARGGTYTAISPEAIAAATRNHEDWMFWELTENSYLRATGECSGQVNLHPIRASHQTGFQLGEGANGWDHDAGASGSFAYDGVITYQGTGITLQGVASMNVDAVPCSEGCVLPSGKIARTANSFNTSTASLLPENEGLSIFPMPAHSQFNISGISRIQGKYTLKIYNTIGQLKRRENLEITNGGAVIAVGDLLPGHYILQLVSGTGESLTKKLIIQ